MIELLLGDEAIALGAIHAGIRGAFSYPGTPSTEIFEYIERFALQGNAISARWSANEKVAYEEGLGMSYTGKRALVSMKHVGLNVAADPFMSSALTGVQGGLVLVVADDPSMHSSQNEQDTRYYSLFAKLPLFEPTDQQEAYDMTREAFELSEEIKLPVMVRVVTRLAHSRSNVRPKEPYTGEPLPRVTNWRDWTLLPVNARKRFRQLLEMQPTLLEYAEQSRFNELKLRGSRGILASGLAYNYVCEALGRDSSYSVLKIGAYPVPAGLVRALVDHCEDIFVMEEGYPFIESQLQGLLGIAGKNIEGRLTRALPAQGELTPDLVRTALGLPTLSHPEARDDLPGRPPQLCTGCPHCDTYQAITDLFQDNVKPYNFGDIGCYTLSALPPYNAMDTCVDMGASISMAHGAAKAGAHPVICSIGDSTFIHSGMTGLIGAAKDNANMTVFILDNSVVAMTGGQGVFTTPEDLERIVLALGVPTDHFHKIEPHPKNAEQNKQLIQKEINHRGLSVILACRPCLHAKRKQSSREAVKATT